MTKEQSNKWGESVAPNVNLNKENLDLIFHYIYSGKYYKKSLKVIIIFPTSFRYTSAWVSRGRKGRRWPHAAGRLKVSYQGKDIDNAMGIRTVKLRKAEFYVLLRSWIKEIEDLE